MNQSWLYANIIAQMNSRRLEVFKGVGILGTFILVYLCSRGALLMSSVPESIRLEDWIRDIPDFPQKGILFKDITPLLQDKAAFHAALDRLAAHYAGAGIQAVVGVESRGFIFGSVLAYLLNCGFVPVRKFGKLPYQTVTVEYELEYGTNIVEIHTDGIKPGQRVLIVDDLLATGGTVSAAMELVEKLGGHIAGIAFLVELTFLRGREQLKGHDVFALIKY
jgi:adenine phosphoribosyltransferase